MAAATSIDWNSNPDAVSALSVMATRAFSSSHEAAQAIFGLIHDLFGYRICVLTRIDLATNTLTVLDAFDRVGVGLTQNAVVPADEMPCDFVVRSAKALRHSDLSDHPIFSRLPICSRLGVHSYVGVPLRRSDGTIWGTLAASDTHRRDTSDSQLELLVVLARLVVFEFEREEQREAMIAHARVLEERLAMAEALEEERLRAVRLQTVLEAAATVSHEVNNPLTVMQLRLGRLMKRLAPGHSDMAEDLEIALEAADEIHQVTVRLRQVVRPVSTHYLSGQSRMLDLAASICSDHHQPC